jgi:hypothetical protein
MKHVTLCGGSGTRSRFRLGSPKYRAVPVVKIGKCANGWNWRNLAVRPRSGEGQESTPNGHSTLTARLNWPKPVQR